jgi:hypothetical protein
MFSQLMVDQEYGGYEVGIGGLLGGLEYRMKLARVVKGVELILPSPNVLQTDLR